MAESFATRVSRQIHQMMEDRAAKNQQERQAKAEQEAQQRQAAESRPTLEQIRQDRSATEKSLKELGID